MESLIKRFEATQKALSKLKRALKNLENSSNPVLLEYYEDFRNSAIQTFKFSMDTFWKLIKEYLDIKYSISTPVSSPRSIFREAVNLGIIQKEEMAILSDMVADRNLTSHTYNEFLAEDISKRLPEYYQLMHAILDRIKL